MFTRQRARLVAMVGAGALTVVLALTACTSQDDPSSPQPGSVPDEGPLTEFLGFSALDTGMPGLPQLSEQDELRQRALQEIVAKCMTDAGFEYVPVSVADQLVGAFGDAYQLSPAEFAEQYGYGVTTLGADTASPDALVDPNEEIRAGLSETDQEAYDTALWGGVDADEPGCYGLATAEVYGTADERTDGIAEFQELFDGLSDLYRRIDEDPRLAAAYEDWASCMAQAGYPDLGRPADAQQSVLAQVSQVRGDEDALVDVREYELALAAADHGCQQEHVVGPRAEVVTELEGEFVAEHRDDLERYRDWLAS